MTGRGLEHPGGGMRFGTYRPALPLATLGIPNQLVLFIFGHFDMNGGPYG